MLGMWDRWGLGCGLSMVWVWKMGEDWGVMGDGLGFFSLEEFWNSVLYR